MEYGNNTAVIVVDMQNDFTHPEGALYAEKSKEAIYGVNDVLQDAHREGAYIFLTKDTHYEGDPEFEKWGEHCVKGSWGQQINVDIDLSPDVYPVIEKDSYDAFHGTELHDMLQQRGIEEVVICGTLVNVCVQETASTASLLGYDVYVVEDSVGYLNEEQKQRALDHIDFLIGDVVTTLELRGDDNE